MLREAVVPNVSAHLATLSFSGHIYIPHIAIFIVRENCRISFDAGAKHRVAEHEGLAVPVRTETATSLY